MNEVAIQMLKNTPEDTADTMLMANDIKKLDIDSLREANERLEQENKELKEEKDKYYQQTLDDEILMNELSLEVDLRKKESDFYLEKLSKYRSALEEILESAKNAQCLPCGSGNLEDCLNCDDETTNNGQFCMEKRIHEIKTKCVEVLNND